MASAGQTDDQFIKTNLSEGLNITPVPLNTSTTLLSESSPWPTSWEEYRTFPIWLYGVIFVLGLFGNSLVIVAVLVNKNMRNSMNILIVSLAVADLLYLITWNLKMLMSLVALDWPVGNFSCKLGYFFQDVSIYASVYMLVLMSLYRYLVVVHPIRSIIWASVQNTGIAVAVLWIIILCVNTPHILLMGMFMSEEFRNNATFTYCFPVSESDIAIYTMTFPFFTYIIPLGIIMVLYGLMLKRLYFGDVPGEGNQPAERMRTNMRVTRMVIIVVVVFALCWLPLHIIFIIPLLDIDLYLSFHYNFLCIPYSLAYLNSSINPILYTFLSQNFRQSFRKVIVAVAAKIRV